MSVYGKILSLSYNSAVATKTSAIKSYYRSVRLIKDVGTVNPGADSATNSVLLCGNCIDPETRNLYVFYIDRFYDSAWIIEFNVDSRLYDVVYYDKYNAIGFHPDYKIYNARVVHGRLIWTDNLNPVYQIDIARAKRSYDYKIGYGQYPDTTEWIATQYYWADENVSNGIYFYKCLVNNSGIEPKTNDGLTWKKLCLIEDAYYSMNVENFYFEPVPPKLPPVVTYESDNGRKINNLRKTLFQISYRYVYMDWRKSTFSPASIVPVPQAEEETATGLANEHISLNNKLKITFNLGGEEVRAVEIIGRSSDDPSTWYLIETINKIEEEERGDEVSEIVKTAKVTMSITVMLPTVISANTVVVDAQVPMSLAVMQPTVLNLYVSVAPQIMAWNAEDITTLITGIVSVGGAAWYNANLVSKPSWITIIETLGGLELTPGGIPITDGMQIALRPNSVNVGTQRTGFVVLKDTTVFENSCTILVYQQISLSNPAVGVYVHTGDPGGLLITVTHTLATNGSAWIYITFTPDHPLYGPLVDIGINYQIYKEGVLVGDSNGHPAGSVPLIARNLESKEHLLTMEDAAAPGEVILVYVWVGELIT